MKAYQVVPTLNGVGRDFDLCIRVDGVVYDIVAGDFDYDDQAEQVFMLTVTEAERPPYTEQSSIPRLYTHLEVPSC